MNRLGAFKAPALGRCANPPRHRPGSPAATTILSLPRTAGRLHRVVGMSSTPLYDAMVGDLVARARDGDVATGALSAAATLHRAGPGGACHGCGLDAPCPTAVLLDGTASLETAQSEARRLLAARASAGPSADREEEPERPPPVLPSAAELFAPNPGTARALDALLGGPPGDSLRV